MEASSLLLVFALATTNVGQSFSTEDFAAQNKIYQNWWSTDFETNFDKLPLKGGVEDSHRPYSGYIYPDTGGGTIRTLRKYDAAFNGRRSLATSFEQWDTTSQKERKGRGFFGRGRMRTPHWHGHCNGWAAAAIRHAEPQNSVVRNGYTFTPSDIKALLAEIYIYREEELFPGSEYYVVNPPTFHLIMTNWLGRQAYPIAMEGSPGKEKWNYPIYKFDATANRYNDRLVEVDMTITYSDILNREYDQAPHNSKTRRFRYRLDLNSEGNVVGGVYYRGSSQVDMLWAPRPAVQGGQPGNERGNPHVDVAAVIDIWKDSVPEEVRLAWHNAAPKPAPTPVPENVTEEPAAETASELASDSETEETAVETTPAAGGGE